MKWHISGIDRDPRIEYIFSLATSWDTSFVTASIMSLDRLMCTSYEGASSVFLFLDREDVVIFLKVQAKL